MLALRSTCACFIGYLLLAYLMLAFIALMTSAISYGVALKVKSEDALAPLMNTVAQPVLLLSGILLPLTYAPLWLQRVANWNPFSWAVEGTRALFAGDIGNDRVWQGLVSSPCSPCSASSGPPASSPAASAEETTPTSGDDHCDGPRRVIAGISAARVGRPKCQP